MGVGCWMGVGRLAVGCWVLQGGDEVALPELRWLVWKPRPSTSRRYSHRRCRRPVGIAIAERWVLGCLGVGCWVLGARQGRPGVRRLKGRWVALSPPVSRRPGSYPSPHLAAAAPKGEGTRAPSRRLPPKHLAGSQRGLNTPYIRRYREAEEKNLGVGCSILGVGCLRIWALGVYHGFWALGVYHGFWALGGTDHLLGVGCWALDASGEGVGWCWRTPRGDGEVGAQVPRPALI